MKPVLKKYWALFSFILIFGSLEFLLIYFEVRYFNLFLESLKVQANWKEIYTLLGFLLLIMSFVILHNFLTNFMYWISEYFFIKFGLGNFIKEYLSKNIAKYVFATKEGKTLAFTKYHTILSLYIGVFTNLFNEIVNFLAILISLAILSPIILAYLLPLIILVSLAPLVFQALMSKTAEFAATIQTKPRKITLQTAKMLFSDAINDNFGSLETSYRQEMEKEVLSQVPQMQKLYAFHLFLSEIFSTLFYLFSITITILIAIYASWMISISLLVIIVLKLPQLKQGSIN
ncbi:Uncharacterised protein (plasmid) [Mycoplasmopsis gallopavonis]|uniref:ABC transporter ATP-binding protein n=1 Tax=Mycoplasmopsis gallopavonis TaxID=76629 RepID=A0A449B0F8_9BACT|nr:hypothetical protein [Mycoplasmopsis gallopavonis]VEU73207.1 Uncharacterised protein [Mycoplasmopsis gallopavonis]